MRQSPFPKPVLSNDPNRMNIMGGQIGITIGTSTSEYRDGGIQQWPSAREQSSNSGVNAQSSRGRHQSHKSEVVG